MAKFILSAFADEAASSLEGQIKALKDNGIYHIEPRNIDGRGILDYSDGELSEIKKALDDAGIKVNSLGSPIGKYNIEDDNKPHFELFKKALSAAEILGTENIRMFSFFIPEGEREKYKGEVITRLSEMCAEAKRRGIKLCHENEAKIYGEAPENVKELLEALPELYAIFDPANYRMAGCDVISGIEASFINFKYMHVKDAIYKEQMIVPAGEGEGKIAEIINLIDEKTDGDVYLTLEPHLHIFDAYKTIDEHELRGKYKFSSNEEAFAFAASALKNLLIKNKFTEGEDKKWTR